MNTIESQTRIKIDPSQKSIQSENLLSHNSFENHESQPGMVVQLSQKQIQVPNESLNKKSEHSIKQESIKLVTSPPSEKLQSEKKSVQQTKLDLPSVKLLQKSKIQLKSTVSRLSQSSSYLLSRIQSKQKVSSIKVFRKNQVMKTLKWSSNLLRKYLKFRSK